MSNFKKMVEARRAKTGESYQTAARAVRAQAQSNRAELESLTIRADNEVGCNPLIHFRTKPPSA
jgi:hypothetical protein